MVKKLFVFLLLLAPLMALHFDAEAGRLGGGRTIGRSYNAPSRPAEVSRPSAPPAQPGAAAKPRPAWQGILGGALLGLGLGALFSSLGLGSMMSGMLSTLLMVGLAFFAIMFLMRFFNRRKEAQNAPYAYTPNAYNQPAPTSPQAPPGQAYSAPSTASGTPEIGSGLGQTSANPTPASDWTIPADFDQTAFLRQAKTQFIRLQAAWDKADLNDLREFTTNEMFAEIKVDLQDRGTAVNVTEVITVEARLLGIRTTDTEYVASVQLTGTIKEAVNAPTNGFSEVWYMSKGKTSGGWLLAGIEQR